MERRGRTTTSCTPTTVKTVERGFTLLELIAVLVLVGILLAFTPSGLQALIPERELNAEVGRLRATLEALMSQSILDQASYAMHYDTDHHRWAMQIPDEVSRPNPDSDGQPIKTLELDTDPDFSEMDWHKLPDGITIQLFEGSNQIRGRFMVTFDPRGTVPPHAVIFESNRIASLDENDRTRTLKVNFSGLVSYSGGRIIEDFKLTEAELGR